MYRILFTLIMLIPAVSHAKNADDLVKAADEYRQSAGEIIVNTVIKLYKDNKLDRERAYDVYIKPDRQSLVISKTPSEKGQKVLMIDDKFWLLLPKTKRPIRITPMQKLLGEASTGDIATMKWHEDYSAEYVSTHDISESGYNELLLKAKRKGVTYKKIHLSLASETNIPLRAELFLTSGKLAKIAYFEVSDISGREQISKMILKDKINKNQYTEVEYIANEPYTLNQKYFNPAYLARNPSANIR